MLSKATKTEAHTSHEKQAPCGYLLMLATTEFRPVFLLTN